MPGSTGHRQFVKASLKNGTRLRLRSPGSSRLIPGWRRGAGVAGAALTLLRNLVGYHVFGRKSLDPLYVVWYVTLRCNLSCAFCDDGTGKKYPQVRYPELGTAEALRLLELIREACRSIYFTGGEPFVRKDFSHLLRRSRELGFWPIFVNTNLSLPEPSEGAVRDADVLIVSLGSTDESQYDRVLQSRSGQTRRVLENLRRCARWQAEGGPRVVVNCVISGSRVEDARSVLGFCREQGLWFSPVAENRGVYVDPQLLAHPEYDRLVEEILAAKKAGQRIYGSPRGLETLLRARFFQCYPTLVPRVYPDGDLFYPCHPLRQKAANILEKGSFRDAWRSGRDRFSPMPPCDNRCHLPCYVNNHQWMEHPLEMVLENFRVARQGGRVVCQADGIQPASCGGSGIVMISD
ncbi:MAG: radical SAM protein [Acidobacteria bacterium]|nr:radical SAM protein [Acidobacteriota bacterium]